MKSAAPLVLVLVLALAACGGEQQPVHGPEARLLPPGDPEAALAWVEEVDDDAAALRARLDAWPLAGEAFTSAEETQIALTWRLQLALRDGDVERARTLRDLLVERFEGRGQYPEGRTLGAGAVRLAVFEEALLEARRRIDGARPDPRRAAGALEVAEHMLTADDTEDRARLLGTRAWVQGTRAADLLGAVGAAVQISTGVRATLVVIADDFTLGEGIFFEVLKQWGEHHGDEPFDRVLVPLLRGQVRVGLRLVPAESDAAELASIGARCGGAGLSREEPMPVERLERIGLGEGDAALFLVDPAGRVVARLSGRNPDPRVLEPALQRLLSR